MSDPYIFIATWHVEADNSGREHYVDVYQVLRKDDNFIDIDSQVDSYYNSWWRPELELTRSEYCAEYHWIDYYIEIKNIQTISQEELDVLLSLGIIDSVITTHR